MCKLLKNETTQKNQLLKLNDGLIHSCSEKAFKGSYVNRTCHFKNGGSLKVMFTSKPS